MQNEFIAGKAEYHPTHEEGAYTDAVYDSMRFPIRDITHYHVSEIIEVMQKGIELHYMHCGFVEFERGKGVEYRREVHPQPRENRINMLDIAEADENGGEEEADTYREKEDRGEPREEDHQHRPMEGDAVRDTDQHDRDEGDERKKKIHASGEDLRKREYREGHSGLVEEVVVIDDTGHRVGGARGYEGKDYITGQDVDGVIHIDTRSSEDAGKDERHYEHREQGVEHRPDNSQNGTPVLIFDAFDDE